MTTVSHTIEAIEIISICFSKVIVSPLVFCSHNIGIHVMIGLYVIWSISSVMLSKCVLGNDESVHYKHVYLQCTVKVGIYALVGST